MAIKQKKVKIVNESNFRNDLDEKYRNITEGIKKYPFLCNKVDSDYRNEKVQKRLWKLEVKRKAPKVDLKKIPVQEIRRNLHKFLWLLFAYVKLRAFKINLTRLETPHQDRFVELSFSNTVNDKFDQIYEDERQCPEYALTEGTRPRESANKMNVEPTTTTQPQRRPQLHLKANRKISTISRSGKMMLVIRH